MHLRRKRDPYPGVRLLGQVAVGGQATVHLGEYKGERVAVKMFSRAKPDNDFKRELSLLLRCGAHRNLVQLVTFFEAGKKPAIVTKWAAGGSLYEHLDTHGPMSCEQVRRVGASIASAVVHLHSRGIVHRDVKSSNIMLHVPRYSDANDKMHPVLIDLGIGQFKDQASDGAGGCDATARCTRDVTAVSEHCLGSLQWMSPEMLRNRRWNDKTDTYGFGVVLWEMVTGRQPFEDPTISNELLERMIMNGARPSLERVSGVDDEILQLIECCWDQDPQKRPSMFDVMRLLQKADGVAIFRQMDPQNASELDFGAFVSMLDTYAPDMIRRDHMASVFEHINTSGTGMISFSEFIQFFWTDNARGQELAFFTLPAALQSLQERTACTEEAELSEAT